MKSTLRTNPLVKNTLKSLQYCQVQLLLAEGRKDAVAIGVWSRMVDYWQSEHDTSQENSQDARLESKPDPAAPLVDHAALVDYAPLSETVPIDVCIDSGALTGTQLHNGMLSH